MQAMMDDYNPRGVASRKVLRKLFKIDDRGSQYAAGYSPAPSSARGKVAEAEKLEALSETPLLLFSCTWLISCCRDRR